MHLVLCVGRTVRDIQSRMTILSDFIQEIARQLDARTDKPLAPHHWIRFVKLLADIDRDDEMGELRQQMEQIVSQRDVRFQDRCLALIPLLSTDPSIASAFTGRRHAALTALAAL
jgi:hypothetical protein